MKGNGGSGVVREKQRASIPGQDGIVGRSSRRGSFFLRAKVQSVSYDFTWSGYIAYALTEPLLVSVESLLLAMIEVYGTGLRVTEISARDSDWPSQDGCNCS
jgi:hypothetical protein